MAERQYTKNLGNPDERSDFERVNQVLVELGDVTVGRVIHQPGWRWRTDMQPLIGGEWCQARHVGVVLAGQMQIELQDGTQFALARDDVFDVPPGHDGWVLGDEAVELIEWSGLRTFAGFTGGPGNRVLATLLFTDLVGSTERAVELGDARWHELLAAHYESARSALDRYRGYEIDTTGDGLFARFEGPMGALEAAAAIAQSARNSGLHIRAGVHVGEVQLVGSGVRGVAVHEAARIMGQAGPDEIFVSEMTRALAGLADDRFDDRGTFTLKGLDGDRHLYAYLPR